MPETNRCLKYGGVHETVPRHECSTEWCEFDDPETIRAEIRMWDKFGNTQMVAFTKRKLKFALELPERA